MTCTINGQTSGPCPTYSFNSANNQITNTGYTYDAAGDLTSDGTNSYQYDAEGREISVNGSSNWAATYNALGQVVQRYYAPQGETDNFVWDLSSHFIANYSQNHGFWWDEFVHDDGRYLADNRQDYDTTWFLHLDQINSWKSVTSSAGGMMQDTLLYPWGSPWTFAGTGWGELFADMPACCGEIGQYITPFRGYSLSQGRWLRPDLLGGDITNPQSLNRYAYVLNNPTTLTDPSGLSPCDQSNPANARVLNFIKANQAAAEKLAVSLGCPAQNILGLSAEESSYGTSPIARSAHNFFGLHGGAMGSTGTYTTSRGVAVSSFPGASGFLSSGESFVNQYGSAVRGISSGTAFAQALVKAHFNTANPTFTSLVASTIASIQGRWNCPQLKNVQGVPIRPTSGGGGTGGGGGSAGGALAGSPGWDEFDLLNLLTGAGGEPQGSSSTTIIGWWALC